MFNLYLALLFSVYYVLYIVCYNAVFIKVKHFVIYRGSIGTQSCFIIFDINYNTLL